MPGVVTWFKVYCGVLCFLYLAVAAASLAFFLVSPEELDMSAIEARITGSILFAVGIVFFALCLAPFVLKPRPWVWIYDLVIICLGMTSACFLPAAIPLLIYWMKPETKAYFEAGNSPSIPRTTPPPLGGPSAGR